MEYPKPGPKFFKTKEMLLYELEQEFKDFKFTIKEYKERKKQIKDGEYVLWLRRQGVSEGTIGTYAKNLRLIPKNVKIFFANPNLSGRSTKIYAYRSYLRFLTKEKNILSRGELMDALDSLKIKKKRENENNDNKWSIPYSEWADYIRKAPTKVAKMGIYLAFHFGLRLSEILHLRIEDIDFEEKILLIRSHKEIKRRNQEGEYTFQFLWYPKYNRGRQLPLTVDHISTLKRWIEKERPKDLPHSYLLWTEHGPRKGLIVRPRNFQKWCTKTGLRAHVCRYSFATHYYEESKDVKLISELLGHQDVSTTSDYLQLGLKQTMQKARDLFNRG